MILRQLPGFYTAQPTGARRYNHSISPELSMTFAPSYDTSRFITGNMPPTQHAKQQQPRPLYFISRNNGTYSALIPADELPFTVRLQGVPRVMSIGETCGMQHIGTLPYHGQCFLLGQETSSSTFLKQSVTGVSHNRNRSQPSAKQWLAPDAIVRSAWGSQLQAASPLPSDKALPLRPSGTGALSNNWRKPVVEQGDSIQASIDAIVAANHDKPIRLAARTPTPASGAVPDQEKKVYCTHWIRHGECDYTQQGCLYKHEMPDKFTLEKIGFRTVPRWYLEKTAPRLQGMSSLPTVGAPMKASEWLRRGSSNCSDADDESETSGTEDESSTDQQEVAVPTHSTVGAAPSTLPQQAVVVLTEAEAVPKMPSTPRLYDSIRKLSYADDLITFSPLIPTPSSSECSTTASSPASTRAAVSTPTSTSESASDAKSPTRKVHRVFVPAGEASAHHIAQARKHVRNASKAERAQNLDMPRMYAAHGDSAKSGAGLMESETKSPFQEAQYASPTPQHSLMASKHAPPVATSSRFAMTPPKPSAPASTMTDPTMSTPTKTANPARTFPGSKGTAVKVATAPVPLAKGLRSANTQVKQDPGIRSACRPRRPAGSVSTKTKALESPKTANKTSVLGRN
jgi:hypothetical protein